MTTNRKKYLRIVQMTEELQPLFGFQQTYSLHVTKEKTRVIPTSVYCGVGHGKAYGRAFAEAHYKGCLYAGVKIASYELGENNEWKFYIAPCNGITAGDHLWMARFILHCLTEEFNVGIKMGSSMHTTFSTASTRGTDGLRAIENIVYQLLKKLPKYDTDHSPAYEENRHGDEPIGSYILIPGHVREKGHGYLEDQRPTTATDPYSVARLLIRAIFSIPPTIESIL